MNSVISSRKSRLNPDAPPFITSFYQTEPVEDVSSEWFHNYVVSQHKDDDTLFTNNNNIVESQGNDEFDDDIARLLPHTLLDLGFDEEDNLKRAEADLGSYSIPPPQTREETRKIFSSGFWSSDEEPEPVFVTAS